MNATNCVLEKPVQAASASGQERCATPVWCGTGRQPTADAICTVCRSRIPRSWPDYRPQAQYNLPGQFWQW